MENIYLKETSDMEYIKNQLVKYDYENLFHVPIVKVSDFESTYTEDDIIAEYPLSLILDNKYTNTFLCTPYNLNELVIGFLASKGYITNKEDILDLNIDKENRVAQVKILKKKGIEDKEVIFLNSLDYIKCQAIENDMRIESDTIYKVMERNINSSKLFKDTGGVHSVAIFNRDEEIVISEDVARHNAMDKAIGYCMSKDISLKDKVVVVSGRISLEMILKAAQTQIPVVISKSAPTNLSVELSKKLNITLIGFVRGRRMNIYTNPHRVIVNKG